MNTSIPVKLMLLLTLSGGGLTVYRLGSSGLGVLVKDHVEQKYNRLFLDSVENDASELEWSLIANAYRKEHEPQFYKASSDANAFVRRQIKIWCHHRKNSLFEGNETFLRRFISLCTYNPEKVTTIGEYVYLLEDNSMFVDTEDDKELWRVLEQKYPDQVKLTPSLGFTEYTVDAKTGVLNFKKPTVDEIKTFCRETLKKKSSEGLKLYRQAVMWCTKTISPDDPVRRRILSHVKY